ncbi:MAG TPA: riboflavin biosynthesis protein RibF [Candidatus Baltobacteraceae bacterium]|jgi:riboflavin kinase/FMN adenylyltransferase|nr:riboflavin biosynthesis protein RibF [Candidatus Baltobacteraceae bacterium]
MKLHYELKRGAGTPLVLAIGFFDGMHRGHQDIARQTLRLRKPGWRAGVLTFSNHPASFLRPGNEPPLICTPEERIDLFARAGFDECFFVPFDDRVASQHAERFLRQTLIQDIGVRGVVVGTTFRFGHKRSGDTALMKQIFDEVDVTFVPVANTVDEWDERISSSRIRKLIGEGKMHEADLLLGHSYEVRGAVQLGAGRGHDLGFPTANIAVPSKLLPKDGVYTATARYEARDYAALVSIGTNPTFSGSQRTVEAWLRDFRETVYGREIALRDFRFLRDQERFGSPDELIQKMNADVNAVAYPAYG